MIIIPQSDLNLMKRFDADVTSVHSNLSFLSAISLLSRFDKCMSFLVHLSKTPTIFIDMCRLNMGIMNM